MSNKDVTAQLNKILNDYSKEVVDVVSDCSKEVSDSAVSKLKMVRFHTGNKYSKSWAVKEEKGTLGTTKFTIYNKKHYRLTHLLEYGHVVKNGTKRVVGNARAFPHIKPIEEWIQNQLPKDIANKLGGK